jgi:hypothetical protein
MALAGRPMLALAAAMLLLAASSAAASEEALPCEDSGYCSVSKLPGFSGGQRAARAYPCSGLPLGPSSPAVPASEPPRQARPAALTPPSATYPPYTHTRTHPATQSRPHTPAGDIVDSPGIRALAQARSFKRELILTICTNNHLTHCLQVGAGAGLAGLAGRGLGRSHGARASAGMLPTRRRRHHLPGGSQAARADPSLRPSHAAARRPPPQWYQNMRAMGYEHTVVLTEGHNASDCDALRRIEPGLGCAWDSTKLPPIEEFAGGWQAAAAPGSCALAPLAPTG